jgi:hypothetical protein
MQKDFCNTVGPEPPTWQFRNGSAIKGVSRRGADIG